MKGGAALWARIGREILGRVQILPFGDEEARRCGDLLAALAKAGTPIEIEDAQIAATALTRGFAVVTGNVRHFQRIAGLRVESWLA